ncbi:hypothetical protein HQ393_09395 [Chitinibacter bivalviorum]|uniref:Uncharacterized protein n=1 Tax=Chitinibacter bivalviorum TaxID=2739434 RepID=A0A7H9BM42_9NEIS|nr:hypothetical protein [Chitinibacter bivalviorum]QLG88444.1 hypothetical protein HQ393_09395 [Chitinibacter bivalviorum]
MSLSRILWLAAAVLALLLALGYQQGLLNLANKSAPIERIACPDLQAGCQFQLNKQQFWVQSEQAIGGNQLFTVLLKGSAKQVLGSWQMQGMDMGPNQYRFIQEGSDRWRAKMALPMCTASRQDWLFVVTVDQQTVELALTIKNK